MKIVFKFIINLFFISIFILNSKAQNNYLINNFSKEIYKAGNQNWAVDIDNQGIVYVANNKGLLVFDGTQWQLFELPGKTLLRSVAVFGNKIFTGSYQEFGYWSKTENNLYKYHSVSNLLNNFQYNNDEIWRIASINNKVYFQSFGAIFEYDYKTVRAIPLPGPIMFLLKAKNRLFVQEIGKHLYELKNSRLELVKGSQIFKNKEVNLCIEGLGDTLIFGTTSGELYTYVENNFVQKHTQIDAQLAESKLNNGIRLNDKIVLGTILDGIFVLNMQGKLVSHISTENRLQNNTILALKPNKMGNLWVALDKGIDFISFDVPIATYIDSETHNSAVYTAAMNANNLYVGTNHGIYHYEYQSDGRFIKKGLIHGSQGQVWFLKWIDNRLYVGLNDGTYVLENNQLTQISEITGGYNLQKFLHQSSEFLIQSTYSSLVIYKKEQNNWIFRNRLEGFSAPSPLLEMDFRGNIWLQHSIKGVYKLQYSQDLQKIIDVQPFFDKSDKKINCTQVTKINNYIVFCTGDQLYTWDDLNKTIIPYEKLNQQLHGFEHSTRIVPHKNNQYWFFNKNEIGLFEIEYEKVHLIYRFMLDKYKFSLVENYENIVSLNENLSLLCLDNGFAILNYKLLNLKNLDNFKPQILRLVASNENGKKLFYKIKNKTELVLKNKCNNFQISFLSQNAIGSSGLYQYKLEGIDNEWSAWSTSNLVHYTRLPAGNYIFKVKGLNNNGLISETATISIYIKPAWYASFIAIFIYILLIISLLILGRSLLKRRWQKHHQRTLEEQQAKLKYEKEQAEQSLILLQNEKLQAEVNHKNNQLASSTMSIISKNELLTEIKSELEKFKDELGYRLPKKYYGKIIHLIDQNISSESDWKSFETLFDQAHENFFKRLKTTYPDLTPGDLKLCAYLRMNLSTKEIVQLLNISVRGVEVHRYRLRKRLNLDSNQNLVVFMMNF